ARIAAQGVRFTQAVSPAPWTLPATVSLLSGWNPHRHGFGRTASDWEVLRGNPDALYLAPALRQAGYLTSAFLNNPYLRPWFGFGPGFYLMRPYHGRAVDGAALALDWLHGHIASPSFMLLHLMDPHWPYDAPRASRAARATRCSRRSTRTSTRRRAPKWSAATPPKSSTPTACSVFSTIRSIAAEHSNTHGSLSRPITARSSGNMAASCTDTRCSTSSCACRSSSCRRNRAVMRSVRSASIRRCASRTW